MVVWKLTPPKKPDMYKVQVICKLLRVDTDNVTNSDLSLLDQSVPLKIFWTRLLILAKPNIMIDDSEIEIEKEEERGNLKKL